MKIIYWDIYQVNGYSGKSVHVGDVATNDKGTSKLAIAKAVCKFFGGKTFGIGFYLKAKKNNKKTGKEIL